MHPSNRWVGLLLAALLASALPGPALAQEEKLGGNPGVKLTRGIMNLTTGWLEVPYQMAEQKETDPTAVWWFFHGLLRGLTMGTARTLYGVWDMITFPVAPYNAPIMTPDTLIHPKHGPRDVQPLPPSS